MVAHFSSPSGARDSRACDRKSAGSHYTEPSKHAAATLTDDVFSCAAAMSEPYTVGTLDVCTDAQIQLENIVIKFVWENSHGML